MSFEHSKLEMNAFSSFTPTACSKNNPAILSRNSALRSRNAENILETNANPVYKFIRQCCLHMNVNNSDANISLQVKQKA